MVKLVYGFGVNDAQYKVTDYTNLDGKYKQIWSCPVYEDWRGILERCFSQAYKTKQPTYQEVNVVEEWKHFSVFRDWVLNIQPNKDWENCVPDKDLLMKGNKLYGPDSVVYIPQSLNNFINDSGTYKNGLMRGVSKVKDSSKFLATCKDPEGLVGRYVGVFSTELEAHLAWKAKKHEYALKLAEAQEDIRVKNALINMFK